jgi:hypothetical protein
LNEWVLETFVLYTVLLQQQNELESTKMGCNFSTPTEQSRQPPRLFDVCHATAVIDANVVDVRARRRAARNSTAMPAIPATAPTSSTDQPRRRRTVNASTALLVIERSAQRSLNPMVPTQPNSVVGAHDDHNHADEKSTDCTPQMREFTPLDQPTPEGPLVAGQPAILGYHRSSPWMLSDVAMTASASHDVC